MRDITLTIDIFSQISTVGMFVNEFQIWCLNFTMIQWLTSLVLLFYSDMFECMREKEKFLGKEKEKTTLRGRESVEMYHKFKN